MASGTRLNPDQHRACASRGPLAVLAGPGTGKTGVIIARLVRLLEQGARAEGILALTFTRKAAGEMRERLAEHVDAQTADRVQVSTFHAFGSRLLRRFGDRLGLPRSRWILDSAECVRLMRELIESRGLMPWGVPDRHAGAIERARSFMSSCSDSGVTPESAREFARAWRAKLEGCEELTGEARSAAELSLEAFEANAVLYELMERLCVERGSLLFDHSISLALRLMREDSFVGSSVRSELKHVVVDEFQDVNGAQIELLGELCPPASSPDLCVVGDDDQAIYGFRGADTRAFARFAERWPDHERVTLRVNYRSGAAIVGASQVVIGASGERFAPEKVIEAHGGDDGEDFVEGILLEGDRDAGRVIAHEIVELLGASEVEVSPADVAVICRTNSYADAMAHDLEAAGLAVDRRRSPKPLEDEAVQDVLAWLRLASGLSHEADVRRLLVRPPHLVEPERVQSLSSDHRRAMRGGEGRSLMEFVAGAGVEAAVLMQRLLGELRSQAAASSAAEVIERVVRTSGVAHAEPLEPRVRARRVRSLIRLLRFSREVQPRLEPPGTVSQFLEHLEALDRRERESLASGDESSLGHDADADQLESSGGVAVITAHGSKGLQFDTVFVPRVRPGHGYPQSRFSDADSDPGLALLVAGREPMSGEAGAGVSKFEHFDEERRIFYVACTRAKRRLVLLAKARKGKASKGTVQYFDELVEACADGRVRLRVRDQHEVLGDAGESLDDAALAESTSREAAHVLLERERSRLRHRAYAALHAAGAGADDDAERMRRLEADLVDAARGLAALEWAARDPKGERDWSMLHDETRARVTAVLERLRGGERPSDALLAPLTPPLELSYTQIKQYLDCPRSYYLRHVLGIGEVPGAAMTLGTVVHRALETISSRVREAEAEGGVKPTEASVRSLVESLYASMRPRGSAWDTSALEQLESHVRRAAFEMGDDAEILEIEQDVRLPYERGGWRHTIVAKLDRVDRLADGGFRIVDYKTGGVSDEKLHPKPGDLQLGIYAMALAHTQGVAPDEMPSGVAEYWLTRTGERGRIDLRSIDLGKVRERINKAIDGMLAGRFDRGPRPSASVDVLPEWVFG